MSGKSMSTATSGRCSRRLLELAEFAVDARQVAHHLGDAHDGDVFGADDAVEPRGGHARSTHAEKAPFVP